MNSNIIDEMGYTILATRLKRISDKMIHSTRLMYKKLAIDIEPNWYLIFVIVQKKPNISVMEIAKEIGFTHQSVQAITDKMLKKEYLIASKGTKDKRKTIFNITTKTTELLPEIEDIWKKGKTVIYELLNENTEITKHLDILETNLNKASFGERIIDKLVQ